MRPKPEKGRTQEFLTFYLRDLLCGLEIEKVHEINRPTTMTPVPQAPEYVLGVFNLRGNIVTVIDVARKMGLSSSQLSPESRILIVKEEEEYIGLLVDGLEDVIQIEEGLILPPPSNVGRIESKFIKGVFEEKEEEDEKLISILDLQEILKVEEECLRSG